MREALGYARPVGGTRPRPPCSRRCTPCQGTPRPCSRLQAAQALDGVFLAVRREAALGLGFDAATFDGFHFYDLDFSYRAHRAGLRVGIALDLLIWHASKGGYASPQWQTYKDRFLDKFPELGPSPDAAPFQPAAVLVAEAAQVAPLYRWIAHWMRGLEPPPPKSRTAR